MISFPTYIFSRFSVWGSLLLILLLSNSSPAFSSEPYRCDWSKFYSKPMAANPQACLDLASTYQHNPAGAISEVTISPSGNNFYIQFRAANFGLESMTATYVPSADTCTNRNPSNGVCETISCIDYPPIVSTSEVLLGCSNNCQYQYQTTIKNWENALAETQREYLPNGLECTNEPALAGVTEYTDTPDAKQCVTILGLTTCIEPNGCKSYNGKLVCNTDNTDYVCGSYNGEVVCYDKNQSTNCGIVNGSPMCLDSEHNIIAANSPDNPVNGGNGDGDESNDVFSRDEIQNQTGGFAQYKDNLKKSIATDKAKAILNPDSNNKEPLPSFKIPEKYSGASDLQTSSSNYYNALGEVPIIQALNFTPTLTNDTCPPLQFPDLPYVGSQGTNVHCQMVDDNRPALEILFKALWVLAAIFIIFLG